MVESGGGGRERTWEEEEEEEDARGEREGERQLQSVLRSHTRRLQFTSHSVWSCN